VPRGVRHARSGNPFHVMRDLPSHPTAFTEPSERSSALRADAACTTVLERVYATCASTSRRAAFAVAAFALESGIGPACRARIGGAVAELVDNCVRRAYPDRSGVVRVTAWRDGCDLRVRILDEGVGFDVARLDEELLATPLHSGLSRAISLAEALTIESSPGRGTRVDLRFTATFIAFGDEHEVDMCDHDFLMPDAARRVLHSLRRPETSHMHNLSPALAVVVGRLLSGPEPRMLAERALWS
jgi:anti-sigma regulatory factor (Ser/Thr protein kinase)